MFLRVSTLVLAIAARTIAGAVNQCNTGSLQCCNSVMNASEDPGIINELGLSPDVPIGVHCSPLGGVQLGSGSQCSQQTACCDNTQSVQNQVIGINCSPVNVNA